MASRFWRGGTGTWDASDTTHWATSSGGAGGASVPGSSDTVTLDGSSGGGTVTVNTTVTVQSITCGAFTGTLDFSINNNNVTLAASAPFSGSGTGTRTIKLGNGNWVLSSTASSTIWNMGTTTNLTFDAGSSSIQLTGSNVGSTTKSFVGGGLTYSTLIISASVGPISISGINTFSTLTATGAVVLVAAANQTITTLNLNGTSGNEVALLSDSIVSQRTLTVTTLSATWAAFRAIVFSGSGLAATNAFDLGFNSGATITAPSTSGATGISRARAASGF